MADSTWNGKEYDMSDVPEGILDRDVSTANKPGDSVAKDLQRRKRRPAQASRGAAPASSTREYYDRQLAEQDAARQAYVGQRGMSDLAARTSQAADRAHAGVVAMTDQQQQERKRRDALQKTLINRVQEIMLPFQRAGLPPIGGR